VRSLLVVIALVVTSVVVNGQHWTPPRTPWGEPDLQGLWPGVEMLGVPLQRPTGLGDKSTLTEEEFDGMFAAVREKAAGGLVFSSDPYFAYRSQLLAELAVRHGVPAMTQSRDFPMAGGLMSYGGDFHQSHRQTGMYAGRILKGEKPSDLPVLQSTKVELVVNLRTAKALGLTLPLTLLGRADEVIE